MRCAYCPLYSSWNTENDSGESCAIFGDAWDSDFQYTDKHGTVQGCYLEKCYIRKVDQRICDEYSKMADSYKKELENEKHG